MKAVELINIVKKYGQQEVLNSFSLDIEKGKCLAVMGESGSGKSTIAKIIIGLEKPNSGEVKIFDKDIEFLFQDSYNALNPRMTIEDLIYEPLQFSTDIDVKDKREFILELLKQVELAPELLETIHNIQIDHEAILKKISQSESNNKEELTAIHQSQMEHYEDILEGYLKIKTSPKDFYNAEERLSSAKAAIEQFDLDLDETLRQLNEADLRDFDISLRILSKKEPNTEL